MRDLRAEVIVMLSIGQLKIGEKTIDTYLPTLKEDLQSFIRKIEGTRQELAKQYPADTEITTGTITLDLLHVKFQNQLLDKENALYKSIQQMTFEL